MLRKELLAFSILALFCLFSLQFFYFLPSTWARLILIITFFAPVVWTITFYLRNHRQEAVIAGTLTLFVVPVLVFLIRNINNLPPFFEGVDLWETRIIVERYSATGSMVSSFPHSAFVQTYFLNYLMLTLAGMPIVYSNFAIILLHIVFEATVGVFVMKVISKRMNDPHSCVPFVIAFSLISSRNLMLTSVPYRYLGAWILPLFFFYYFNGKKTNSRSRIVVLLFLTAGFTLGDPISGLAAIMIFSVNSIMRKDIRNTVYAIIPFSYLLYTGSTYVSFLKEYVAHSWDGLVVFLQGLQIGRLPVRTLPWGRTLSMTNEDSYIVSAAYISLVILASAVFLLQAKRFVKRGKFAAQDEHDDLSRSVCICLFISLVIAVAVYVGASVMPEVSFSDIRTTAMIFVSISLLLSFGSKVLLLQIQTSKVLRTMMIVLLGLCALGTIYQAYPKSVNDPILTLEDRRLDLRKVGYAGMFLTSYYDKGNILHDYKTGYVDLRFVVETPYARDMFSEIRIEDQLQNQLPSDFLVFDLGGLRYISSYASKDTYLKAYEAGLNQNRVYDNGGVVVFWKP